MKPTLLLTTLLACSFANDASRADPIHAITGGAFWHHDSGWEFVPKSGEFELVGFPQDVAGSKDAVAYYAREFDGARIVASVDVYPADSAEAGNMVVVPGGKMASEKPYAVGQARQLKGIRRIFTGGEKAGLTVMYLVTVGVWNVRIRIDGANKKMRPALDSFALEQRWETLSAAPTAR